MSQNPTKHTKVLIIGSGPAGYTAAVYAARAMLNPILIYGVEPGGQLSTTTDVENYPGFSEVIQGPWLMDQMKDQAKAVGTEMIEDHIGSVNLKSTPFEAVGDGGQKYTADSIIISTGAQARWLNLKSEQEFRGFGVSACATCDGFFFKDKKIHVIGGGDSAMEEAIFLTKFAKQVTVVHRRDKLRASKIMEDRAKSNPKIDFLWNAQMKEIVGTESEGVKSFSYTDTKTNENLTKESQGIFVAIGHTPNNELFANNIDLDDNGYIITSGKSSKTNLKGVFAAGDVQDSIYRQAITAAGTGCMAAIDAERFLEENEL